MGSASPCSIRIGVCALADDIGGPWPALSGRYALRASTPASLWDDLSSSSAVAPPAQTPHAVSSCAELKRCVALRPPVGLHMAEHTLRETSHQDALTRYPRGNLLSYEGFNIPAPVCQPSRCE